MTTVEVAQKHIDSGHRACCGACPIALAIKDVLRENVRVNVGWSRTHFYSQGERESVSNPESATRFAMDFDYGHSVQPITLELDIPGRFLKETP